MTMWLTKVKALLGGRVRILPFCTLLTPYRREDHGDVSDTWTICVWTMCIHYTWIFPHDFLNNIFFSLTHFIVIQHVMHLIYKMHVNQLFMWSVRFPVNSGLLVAKFGGSQSYMQNFYCEGSVPLTSSSFKGQLYILCKLPYTPSATPFKALSVT